MRSRGWSACSGSGGRGGDAQPVLIRATPDVRGDTHDAISTGQADSKFGFGLHAAREAIARPRAVPGLDLQGIHAHVGSQLLELAPFERAAAQLATLGRFPVWDLGGGLGIAYTPDQHPPSIEDYVATVVRAARTHLGPHKRLLVEPGPLAHRQRAASPSTRVESVKRNVSTWVAVDGGMSDNLRPMLYGAVYEAHVVDRPGGDTHVRARRQALRVRRRHRRAARSSTTPRPATSSSRPPPAPTATRWPTTTTASRARPSSSARRATRAWSCAARPSTISWRAMSAERSFVFGDLRRHAPPRGRRTARGVL